MRVVKASTALGKRLVAIGKNWDGTFLNQVYDKWSAAKQEAWDKCYEEYCNTDSAEQFSICSWFTPEGMRLETSHNSYLVVFDD